MPMTITTKYMKLKAAKHEQLNKRLYWSWSGGEGPAGEGSLGGTAGESVGGQD